MAGQSDTERRGAAPAARRNSALADGFVVLAMAVVTVALGAVLTLQLLVPVWQAAAIAISVYVGLLAIHALVRKATATGSIESEVTRLEKDIARIRNAPAPSDASPVGGADARRTSAAMRRPVSANGLVRDKRKAASEARPEGALPPAIAHAPGAPPLPPQYATAASAQFAVADAPNLIMELPPHAMQSTAEVESAAAEPPQLPMPGAAPAHDPIKDYWSFRPSAPRLRDPGMSAGSLPPMTADDRSSPPGGDALRKSGAKEASRVGPAPPPLSPRETDVEMIQGLIKKLADEVNGTSSPPSADQAIESSLGALRHTAGTMRNAGNKPEVTPAAPAPDFDVESLMRRATSIAAMQPGGGTARDAGPPPPLPPQSRLARVADAIAAGRADVLLEPVLGLGDKRARHYEVTVRFKDETGKVFDTPDSMPEAAGTELLPLLDSARLARSVQVANRLMERGNSGSLFSAINGASLGAGRFMSDLSISYEERAGLAGQLILTFSQADVRRFTPHLWKALSELRDLGFRFALQHVNDLDMDFEDLKRCGFAFVKLDSGLFLEGLRASNDTVIPAQDICRHLARLGLTLIVGRIDDEAVLARIFGFGVLFGQGQLFGGPRVVKAEIVSSNRGIAAA